MKHDGEIESRYEGDLVDGKLTGQVKATLPDGTIKHIDWNNK